MNKMETSSYLCLFVVILVQSVDGVPISCIDGNCEPTTGITTATANPTTTTTFSAPWTHLRRVICPPVRPIHPSDLYEILFNVFGITTTAKPTKPIYYTTHYKVDFKYLLINYIYLFFYKVVQYSCF